MLYICGTPIGNLEDISIRQLNILKSVDLIAAEDTRHSKKLLSHYGISTQYTSYHDNSSNNKTKYLVNKLLDGKSIALISDSGMPLICDPGFELIKECRINNIPVTTVPGPTAFVSGLIMSGFDTSEFIFLGFLSNKKKKNIGNLSEEQRTVVFYESPHKLIKTLEFLQKELGGGRNIAISREITKFYEEVINLTLEEAVNYYKQNTPIGEFVIVLDGKNNNNKRPEIKLEPILNYMANGYSKKDAITLLSKDLGLPKNTVYKKILELEKL